ncbi:hypothetical protein CAPTEDRAFT_149451 [Capitella teleta]|uniref:AB hydrolase-1 domain-containing protein n=1 Tax=Capitella teleta TaxID=283909 RepID=R7UD05_CAPTE|nr:hypothetical protein CAPTEDRAFT_149451 [Capitella teleta]|eukprot:ELU01147.1 hypothetical protein CAPTEDRAFT_149451 [Capitella teleta]
MNEEYNVFSREIKSRSRRIMLLRSGTRVHDDPEGTGDAASQRPEEPIHATSNNNIQHTPPHNRIADASKPHNVYVMAAMKTVCFTFVMMYFVAPIVLRLNPWIVKEVVFLNKLRWPPSTNLSDPAQQGINHTISLWIPSEDLVGAWHTLPSKVKAPTLDTNFFAQSLSNGSPIVLYLHGNAGTRAGWHRMQMYQILSGAGFHVIAIDYRGFGDSAGYPSEQGVCADAMAAFKWIRKHSKKSPVYIWGHSLGSAVATKVARKISSQGLSLSGVILEAPFNNIKSAVWEYPLAKPFVMMPWFSWVFLEALKANEIYFTTDEHIAAVTAPVLILHAEDDGIVPIFLGRKLYETALANKAIGGVRFHTFSAEHAYGHKHMHKAPELASIISDFSTPKK